MIYVEGAQVSKRYQTKEGIPFVRKHSFRKCEIARNGLVLALQQRHALPGLVKHGLCLRVYCNILKLLKEAFMRWISPRNVVSSLGQIKSYTVPRTSREHRVCVANNAWFARDIEDNVK